MSEAGVESQVGNDQTHAIGSQNSQHVGPGCCKHHLFNRFARYFGRCFQSSCQYDCCSCTAFPELSDQAGYRLWRSADDCQVRSTRKFCNIRIGKDTADSLILWVDRHDRPFETTGEEVLHHGSANAVWSYRCTNESHRLWLKQMAQISNTHALVSMFSCRLMNRTGGLGLVSGEGELTPWPKFHTGVRNDAQRRIISWLIV